MLLKRDRCRTRPEAGRLRAALAAGSYLTDGKVLFRVVDMFEGIRREMLVEVEDCTTLEIILMPLNELAGRNLTLVNPLRAG